MTIKTLIFDFDGTLADTLPLCINAFKYAINALSQQTPTDQAIISTFGPSEEGTIRRFLPPHQVDAGVKHYLQYYEAHHDQRYGLFQGLRGLLDELLGCHLPMAMITGKGPRSGQISIQKLGLAPYFRPILYGSPDGPIKHENILRYCQEYQPTEDKLSIFYVGDTASDMQSARMAGISTVGAAWSDHAEKEGIKAQRPEAYFESIGDFVEWTRQNIVETKQ